MSTSSLPSYRAHSFTRTPSYTAEPHQSERRIALVNPSRSRPIGRFVKKSRNGEVILRLVTQETNDDLPTYGVGGCVKGFIELSKTENIISVEVKLEGRLLLKEIAEGGTTDAKLCLASDVLWTKDNGNFPCPANVPFSLYLPSNLTHENKTYPLPPTFGVKLSGLPGFVATVDYAITVIVTKPQYIPTPSRLPTILSGSIVISAPFKYFPRSRPATPLPSPLIAIRQGFLEAPNWTCHQSEIRPRNQRLQSITTKLYLPTSRIFCMVHPIPFHVTFESTPQSLSSFFPYCPTTATFVRREEATRLQLMRQSTVDVRNAVTSGTKTDMWRIDCIGEGSFRHACNGPTWTAFSGEIRIRDEVLVAGFKVSGLSVKDCILFSMTPPNQQRSPFAELRQLIPVKLTTDPWMADGTGIGVISQRNGSVYSLSSILDSVEETVHG